MVKHRDGLDDVASALANAGRRRIVERLDAGSATTTELATLLAIGLPAVSKHLDVLAGCGVVRRCKVGRVVTHSLDPAPLVEYSTWLTTRRSFWAGQLYALDDAVARR